MGRGRVPLDQSERRPGPSQHVGAVPVPEARSAHHQGSGSTSADSPTVVRGVDLLGRRNEDSLLGLRRPKLVPSTVEIQNTLDAQNRHPANAKQTNIHCETYLFKIFLY